MTSSKSRLDQVRCLQCGSENRPGAGFCAACGKGLDVGCAECGRSLLPGHAFCDGCGAARPSAPPASYTPPHLEAHVLVSRSAIEGERKLVTVLFADLAGFTAIAEQLDPEAVHAIMEGCFAILVRCVHRFEGRVNQFTGDGIMAIFGAPVAHEDHAARALRAALGIAAELRDYEEEVRRRWGVSCRMRIGINTGIALVGPIGDNLRLDYTAVGDTTNLAARLQQSAPPGAIWVSQATHRLASAQFEWETLEPLKVRGREEPVRVLALLALRATPSSALDASSERALTPLIGREQELKQLDDAWSEARQGRGRVVSIVAEAGLGKTRLLHEFKRNVGVRSNTFYEGSCFDHGQSSAYLPFRELLRSLFQLENVASDVDGTTRVERAVAELDLDATVAAAVCSVLSYPVATEPRAMSAQVIRDALRAVVVAVASRRPLVLVIEDLHWIDQATQEVVTGLVDQAQSLQLLLVLMFRPEYLSRWEKLKDHSLIALTGLPSLSSAEMVRAVLARPQATWVALRRISPQQSVEMVRQILSAAAIPAELEALVTETTDGNPLFIEELVVSLIEGGTLVRRGDDWSFEPPPETLRVPDRVQNLFAARVDRLDEDVKELLKIAAVVGRVFKSAVVARVADNPQVESSLQALESLELIYRLPDSNPATYSFKHVLCQEAVYGQIRDGKKRQYHEQVARAMEELYAERLEEHCELLAHHYALSAALSESPEDEAGQRFGSLAVPEEHPERLDKAIEYLKSANRKAIGVSAMAEAQRYYNRACEGLKLTPVDLRNQRRKLELVLDQVFVALALFTYRDYYTLLQEHAAVAEALGDRRLLGAFHARVGWCQWSIGDFAAGIETLNTAVDHCSASGNDEDLGFALMTRAWCELGRGEFEEALASCRGALNALDRKFDLQAYVRTRAAASVVNGYLGRWNEAIVEGKLAIEAAERRNDAGATSFAAMLATWAHGFQGDLEQALMVANYAVSKGDSPADKLFATGSWALVQCRMGHAAKAADALADVVAVIRPMRFPACETFGLYYCEALMRSGELAKAKTQIADCLSVLEPSDAAFYVACAERLLAEVALAEGGDQLAVAGRYFESSMSVFVRLGAANELALTWAGFGRLRQKEGDRERAIEYLTRALQAFEKLGTRIEPDSVRRSLAELG